jgi:hypothetical protein
MIGWNFTGKAKVMELFLVISANFNVASIPTGATRLDAEWKLMPPCLSDGHKVHCFITALLKHVFKRDIAM